jgi:hypothetical protein
MVFPYLMTGLLLLCGPSVLAATEDTAAISFQTNIPYDRAEKPYIVRRGDTLHTIIRNNLGPQSPKAQADIMDSIRKLNPKITNLSRIYPGESIILPAKSSRTGGEKNAFGGKVVFYTVKKGDSLEKILMTQLHVSPGNMTKALRNVKEINPGLIDLNRIAVSQIIRLPGTVKYREPEDTIKTPIPDEGPFDQTLMISETLTRNLVLAGQIINTFGGSLIMEGQYSIPISDHSQITIDCASIPMVEFDNGNAVFIALKTRLPDQVRNIIIADWPNYRFTSVNEKDTLVSILNKIMNQSGIYRMEKGGQFVIGEKPNIHITPDWTIHQVDKDSGSDIDSFGEHGILVYHDASQSLPGYVLRKLSSQGMVLTEIVLGRGVLSEKTGEAPGSHKIPDIAGSSRIDMIYNLLQMLGQNVTKNVELSLVDKSRGGFHLTMRADILLRKGNKNTILAFGALPEEFENILREERYDVLALMDSESKDKIVTKVLTYLQIPNTSNFFRLTVNRTDAPSSSLISAVFPAVQVAMLEKPPYYLVDFSFDQDFYTYFSNLKEVNIIQY